MDGFKTTSQEQVWNPSHSLSPIQQGEQTDTRCHPTCRRLEQGGRKAPKQVPGLLASGKCLLQGAWRSSDRQAFLPLAGPQHPGKSWPRDLAGECLGKVLDLSQTGNQAVLSGFLRSSPEFFTLDVSLVCQHKKRWLSLEGDLALPIAVFCREVRSPRPGWLPLLWEEEL